jgi:hypothetical protein
MKKDFHAILLSKATKLKRFDFSDLRKELSPVTDMFGFRYAGTNSGFIMFSNT